MKGIKLTPEERILSGEKKRIYMKGYNLARKEKMREYYLAHREEIAAYGLVHKDERDTYNKEYREANKEKKKEYNLVNKEKNNTTRSVRQKIRRDEDPSYKLSADIRSLIGIYIRNSGFKKSVKTEAILGCTFEEFKFHIESLWEPWMNWENRSLYDGTPNSGWDIDHKLPISGAASENEILSLNHFSNLQPMCSYVNRYIKKNSINYI